jgi:multiple sugar transport system permease protein
LTGRILRATGGRAAATPAARRRRGARVALLGFAAPAVLWFAVFMVGPLVSVFYLSTLDWGGILATGNFVGLDNFRRLLRDPVIPVAAANTATQLAVVLPTMILLAFMLGYFLSLRPPGYRILSVIFFTAALFSLPARAMMFVGVYMPNGIVNSFLRAVGLDDWTRVWLADASTAFPAVLAVDLWGGIGFTAVLFASRIAGISHEVYEAAEMDGASHWTKMWRVTFPMILGYVGVLTMLQFLWLLLLSAQNVLLLTKGGPGNSTMTLSYYLYDQAFESSRIGYSQAIGVVLFAIGLVGVTVIRRVLRERY